jgi:cytochrome c peroxidase
MTIDRNQHRTGARRSLFSPLVVILLSGAAAGLQACTNEVNPQAAAETPPAAASLSQQGATGAVSPPSGALNSGGHDRGDDGEADHLLRFIDQQVGGIWKFMVPPDDASIPLPRQSDGTVNPRYKTTEEKRYLGKMLFHDPIRTARIDPAYGGVLATKQTGSCGSCHLGEAAGKAGAVLNFSVGGEGRGYTDESGNFIVRRRPRSDLPILRQVPLFPGDALVDALPTLTDIYLVPPPPGHVEVATPARGRRLPAPLQLLATGRLDALDSVGRQSPGMIGFAFNNRLLLGGFAGEPDSEPGALNPFGDPAQENLTLLLLDAHRMLTAESAELARIPVFVKLFRDAFPEEAAQADAAHDMNILINDQTVFRATSTFLRTVVTRNTPFDRFLAGNNHALSKRQRRGAKLFFKSAAEGGAGCSSCHSGPMFNKQINDPDIAGVGQFVEENFINVGIGDHPLQALNRLARNDPNFHDTGRQEITMKADDAFKFRSLTLRQLKDARTFFHSGSFTKVRDVVQYFNAGVPQDPVAGAAPTLDARFTNPRGPGSPRGLGLSDEQVDDLTDFLENGLYDPAFVKYDPNSTTRTLQPNERDLTYSKYRPDLAALGAIDGFVLSGLAIDNNDALSRRDEGLEFLDVTSQLQFSLTQSRGGDDGVQTDTYTITNNSASIVDTHLLVIVKGLPKRVRLLNASGTTTSGDPYVRIYLPTDGVLLPGQSIVQKLVFKRPDDGKVRPRYALNALSGQGKP